MLNILMTPRHGHWEHPNMWNIWYTIIHLLWESLEKFWPQNERYFDLSQKIMAIAFSLTNLSRREFKLRAKMWLSYCSNKCHPMHYNWTYLVEKKVIIMGLCWNSFMNILYLRCFCDVFSWNYIFAFTFRANKDTTCVMHWPRFD